MEIYKLTWLLYNPLPQTKEWFAAVNWILIYQIFLTSKVNWKVKFYTASWQEFGSTATSTTLMHNALRNLNIFYFILNFRL